MQKSERVHLTIPSGTMRQLRRSARLRHLPLRGLIAEVIDCWLVEETSFDAADRGMPEVRIRLPRGPER